MQHLFWCQREVFHNLDGHPVLKFGSAQTYCVLNLSIFSSLAGNSFLKSNKPLQPFSTQPLHPSSQVMKPTPAAAAAAATEDPPRTRGILRNSRPPSAAVVTPAKQRAPAPAPAPASSPGKCTSVSVVHSTYILSEVPSALNI